MATQRHTDTQKQGEVVNVPAQSDKVESVPQQPVNLDEVGNAEAVLMRMIHERKTLEGAAQTLATYRNVRAQVHSEQGKLVQIRRAVSETQEALSNVQKQYEERVKRTQVEFEQYVTQQREAAEKDVATVQQQVSNEQEKLATVQGEVKELQDRYTQWKVEHATQIREAQAALDSVKSEHAALMAQINKVAAQFTTTV